MPLNTHDRTPEQEAQIKQANDAATASRKALAAAAAIGKADQEGQRTAGQRTPEQEAQIAKAGKESEAARAAAEAAIDKANREANDPTADPDAPAKEKQKEIAEAAAAKE